MMWEKCLVGINYEVDKVVKKIISGLFTQNLTKFADYLSELIQKRGGFDEKLSKSFWFESEYG